jgi:hypothetical protein
MLVIFHLLVFQQTPNINVFRQLFIERRKKAVGLYSYWLFSGHSKM